MTCWMTTLVSFAVAAAVASPVVAVPAGAKVDKLRALIDDHLKPQDAAGGEN